MRVLGDVREDGLAVKKLGDTRSEGQKQQIREKMIEVFSTGTMRDKYPVYVEALRVLIGLEIPAAVKFANDCAKAEGNATITTRKFCRWLAEQLSALFQETQP